jgi:hypothetical protein
MGTFTDIADVGTAVDLFISISENLEIQARTVDQVAFQIGDPCYIELPADAITLWPDDRAQDNGVPPPMVTDRT